MLCHLFSEVRIGDVLVAERDEVRFAILKHLLGKFGTVELALGYDGYVHGLLDGLSREELAALILVYRRYLPVPHLIAAGVDVKCVSAPLFQQLCDLNALFQLAVARGIHAMDRRELNDLREVLAAVADGGCAVFCEVLLKGERYASEAIIPEQQAQEEGECERRMAVALFDALSRATGYRPQWGILTGVRPSKLMNPRQLDLALVADHLAHLVLRIGALIGRDAGTGADFVEVIERFVLPGLYCVFYTARDCVLVKQGC